MILGSRGTNRNADMLDQFLYSLRGRLGNTGYTKGHREVDDCADHAEGIGLDAQEPVGRGHGIIADG